MTEGYTITIEKVQKYPEKEWIGVEYQKEDIELTGWEEELAAMIPGIVGEVRVVIKKN